MLSNLNKPFQGAMEETIVEDPWGAGVTFGLKTLSDPDVAEAFEEWQGDSENPILRRTTGKIAKMIAKRQFEGKDVADVDADTFRKMAVEVIDETDDEEFAQSVNMRTQHAPDDLIVAAVDWWKGMVDAETNEPIECTEENIREALSMREIIPTGQGLYGEGLPCGQALRKFLFECLNRAEATIDVLAEEAEGNSESSSDGESGGASDQSTSESAQGSA